MLPEVVVVLPHVNHSYTVTAKPESGQFCVTASTGEREEKMNVSLI